MLYVQFNLLIIMAALCNRAGHYTFAVWFLSSVYLSFYLFSSPNLSGHRLDVYHTSTHGVARVRIYCVLFQIGVYQNECFQVEKDTVIQ